jgi:hypothetical protein
MTALQVASLLYRDPVYSVVSNAMTIAAQQESQALLPG